MIIKIQEKTDTDLLAELEDRFFDIPFQNSAFQNRTIVAASQLTPGRAYRAIGLRMFALLRAIDEMKFGRLREHVDIDQLEAAIADPNTSSFDRRRAEIEINQKLGKRKWAEKLLNDAIAELSTLYGELKKYPAYTREQFELEEATHFEEDLMLQIKHASIAPGAAGAAQSLHAIRHAETMDNLIGIAHQYADQHSLDS